MRLHILEKKLSQSEGYCTEKRRTDTFLPIANRKFFAATVERWKTNFKISDSGSIKRKETSRPLRPLFEPVTATEYLIDIIEFSWKKPYFDQAAATREYVENRLSAQEVAVKFGCAKSTVLKYLKLHGIPIRERTKPIAKTSGSLRYGEKLRQRKILAHKREQDNISKMLELHAKGFNYEQIAQSLNALRVPTKRGSGPWHRRVVRDIIVREKELADHGTAVGSTDGRRASDRQ